MKKVLSFAWIWFSLIRAELRQLYDRYFGKIRRFEGNAYAICAQIVDETWQGNFYKTSLGHFDCFWTRDFGTVAESLSNTGHRDRVHQTLSWAISHFIEVGQVTLCVDKYGVAFNAPANRSIDALPWLLHSIVVSDYDLNQDERELLERELQNYCHAFLDSSGMILPIEYAELRDAVIYDRSAYAVGMVGRLAQCTRQLKLKSFPFDPDTYKDELIHHYWNGEYFNADARNNAFSAECAIIPFYLNVIDDVVKFKETVRYIKNHRLDHPYPLRYTNQPDAFRYRWWMTGPFMPNYAGTSVWSWHGIFYLHVLQRYSLKEYSPARDSFSAMIERHKTWPEMLNPDGSWYYAPTYSSDPGMVWSALYVELVEKEGLR